ncbi:unnamed protein product, partial [Urochloa humidicola]
GILGGGGVSYSQQEHPVVSDVGLANRPIFP